MNTEGTTAINEVAVFPHDAFAAAGFVHLPVFFGAEEVRRWKETIAAMARERRREGDAPAGELELWEGVTLHAELWPAILDRRLLELAGALCGAPVVYLHNSEVHANRAGILWHRDAIDQGFGSGPDWSDHPEPYRLLRACVYLDGHAQTGFRLGVLPGSHRYEVPTIAGRLLRAWGRVTARAAGIGGWEAFVRAARRTPRVGTRAGARGLVPRATPPRWITIDAGDLVLLHQRLLHSTSELHGELSAFYFTLGPPGAHARRHWRHYAVERPDRRQIAAPPALATSLAERGALYDPDGEAANV